LSPLKKNAYSRKGLERWGSKPFSLRSFRMLGETLRLGAGGLLYKGRYSLRESGREEGPPPLVWKEKKTLLVKSI